MSIRPNELWPNVEGEREGASRDKHTKYKTTITNKPPDEFTWTNLRIHGRPFGSATANLHPGASGVGGEPMWLLLNGGRNRHAVVFLQEFTKICLTCKPIDHCSGFFSQPQAREKEREREPKGSRARHSVPLASTTKANSPVSLYCQRLKTLPLTKQRGSAAHSLF